MTVKTIRADQVETGQTVTRVVMQERPWWRKHPRLRDQGLQREPNGHWPTVLKASFYADGEGGRPTVYLVTSDMPGWNYCLAPDDQVTIEED